MDYEARCEKVVNLAEELHKTFNCGMSESFIAAALMELTDAVTRLGFRVGPDMGLQAPKPEATKAEAPKPEAAKPAKPEAAKPEAAKPEAPKAEAAKPEAAKPEADSLTLDDLRRVVNAAFKSGKEPEIRKILREYDAEKLPQLNPAVWKEVYIRLEAL